MCSSDLESEHVGAHTVEQCREQNVDGLFATDHRRDARTGQFIEGRERCIHRFVATAAERTAEPVQQCALRFMHHFQREIAGLRGDDELRERAKVWPSD